MKDKLFRDVITSDVVITQGGWPHAVRWVFSP